MALEHEYPLSPAELFGVLTDLDYLKARHERFGGVGTPTVEARWGQRCRANRTSIAAR